MVVQYIPPGFRPGDRSRRTRGYLQRDRDAPRGENGVISLSGRTSVASDPKDGVGPSEKEGEEKGTEKKTELGQDTGVNYFVLPLKVPDECTLYHHESYTTMLITLRNQILSLPQRPFARPLSEREWLRNAARMWDLVKKSPVLAEYVKFMQSSGLYRR